MGISSSPEERSIMLGPSVVLREEIRDSSVVGEVEAPCSVVAGESVSGTAVGGDVLDWAKELLLLVVFEAMWFPLSKVVVVAVVERLSFLQGRGRERTGTGS
jgi:hypothetical protein